MQNNTELLCLILEFQSRSLIVQSLLQAEAAKEYKADWLKNTNTVVRDGAGKFARKGASITQSVQDTTAILKQGFDLTTDTIQSLVKDPEFRKRTGLATGLPIAKLISSLANNPKLTERLDEWIADATKEFADQYGDDKSPMAQAIRKGSLAQPPKDASFNEKMEFRVAQYAAYQEALKNPEDFSKRDEIIGKAAAASIPIGVSLAIALGFEVAIPLFLAQSVNWATILSSVALGEAADFAIQKGMDKAEINNPWIRIGVSIAAGVLAGGLVTGVGNKIALTKSNKVLDDHIKAIKYYDEALKTDPKNSEMLGLKAKHYFLLSKYEDAVESIDEALKIDPKNKIHLLLKGGALAALEKPKEALEAFDKILEIGIKHSDDFTLEQELGVYFSRGRILAALNRYEEALESLDKIIEIDPKHFDATSLKVSLIIAKGCNLGTKGKYSKAIDMVDEALKIDPKNTSALKVKGLALRQLDEHEEAIETFDKVLKINPKEKGVLEKKANSLQDLNRHEDAIKLFDEVLKIDPKSTIALNNKGVSLEKLGKYEEALKYYEKALKIEPNDVLYKKNRDYMLKKLGKL
jgi:tetratricopeptide (TPR) repeat protein